MSFAPIISCCKDLLKHLPNAREALDYSSSRISPSALDRFELGYFPSNNNLQTLISLIGEPSLKALDLIYDKTLSDGVSSRTFKHSSLEHHNLIMPYKDVYGNIIAIVGRSILPDDKRQHLNISKYKNTSFNKGSHFFGLFEAKDSVIANNAVFIVEGQFDAISAQDKGIPNTIALGSSNMTFEQFALITRYTNNLMLLLDNDNAGKLGAEKIIKSYGRYANIKQCKIPDGYKDIDDALKDNSIEDISLVIR